MRSKILQNLLMLATAFIFCSTTYADSKSYSYTSVDKKLTLIIPPMENLTIYEGHNWALRFVEFSGDNDLDAKYSIEWAPQNNSFPIQTVLVGINPKMKEKARLWNIQLQSPSCQSLTLSHAPAYQCIAMGDKKGEAQELVGTSIYYKHLFIDIFMLFPTIQRESPPDEYQQLMDSIKVF